MSAATEIAQVELAAIVGAARVVADPAACAAFAVDGQAPQYVVYPTSPDEVAAVLRCAAARDLAVIPCRNATKLGVGNPPRRYDVALSLKDLNRVWHYEPADLTITAEPGMKLGDFQHFVARDGLWLPLDPPGGARASLGGIVATNAAGPLRLAYGAPRDIVLGMKIATTEGKIVKTGGRVVKNVTGYDVGKLLIGSYGTLGVIVEISFKLFPLPPQRATFVIAAGTLGVARDLRQRILQSPLSPARMVLLDRCAAQQAGATAAEHTWTGPEIWLEVMGSARLIERCRRELGELAGPAGAYARGVDAASAENVWARATNFHPWVADAARSAVIVKATMPDSALEELVSRAEQEAEAESAEIAVFAQLGVGIVHLCILTQLGAPALLGLIQRLRASAEGLGGALIVEHCPPEIKQHIDVWGEAGDSLELMKKLKAVWDPQGILAPGRFLGRL